MKRRLFLWLALPLLFLSTGILSAQAPQLPTVAERSEFKATSRHAEVMSFCEQLARQSPLVHLDKLGTSSAGRTLPLLVVADPPVKTAEEAARSQKLVVLAVGNIHAGEVDGKEALLMLARDLAASSDKSLFKHVILLVAPILNADGNEEIKPTNRPQQAGPALGVGQRANADGLDLNRDFTKLETPEVRALVRTINRWDPAVLIDTHTTNGSHHRYTLTYDGPRHPSVAPALSAYVSESLLPDVSKRLEKRSGYKSHFYGNFSWDRTRWEPYPAEFRYGVQYMGLRGKLGILSESYAYAPYKDRVLATRDFVRSCLEHLAENRDKVASILGDARTHLPATVPVRHKLAPLPGKVKVLGFEEQEKDGKRVPTEKPKDYQLEYLGRTEASRSVARPYSYLVPVSFGKVLEVMQRHGIDVEELREDIELNVEVTRIDKLRQEEKAFQRHRLVTIEQATSRKETRRVPAGTLLVRTNQPLGNLIVQLLEPEAEDGLCTWNHFDAVLMEGRDFPILRLPAEAPITLGKVRPLPEDRSMNRTFTFETVYAGGFPLSLGGNPVSNLIWLEDGEHFLQVKSGKLMKVHAVTGRAQPFVDAGKMTTKLAAVPGIDRRVAEGFARRTTFQMNPQRTGALLEHEHDLYFVAFDGSKALRLTKTPQDEELPSFSPNGEWVAFVRGNNLHVVDLATQTERALTADGSATIFNGKADWVYFEEIFNRSYRAYWWSPDSTGIALLRFDDGPVPKHVIVDHVPTRQVTETAAYPKAGDPNPIVKLGIVQVAGGPVQFADLSQYSETASLIVRAGWFPDSQKVYFYVQDRAQTWLDICTTSPRGGEVTRLLRETTQAWVEDPGELHFLKDGSFLLASERSGWKHLYHYAADGKQLRPVTNGDWEARTVHLVDAETGWVYLSGTRDSHIGQNLYRVKLDGSGLQRLTASPGDHRTSVSPKGNLFIDSHGDHATPTRVHLCKADGQLARVLDTNPVYAREEYRFGQFELVQIKMPDGFVLEGSLLKPPDFDPTRRYPVWFMTYAGPHAPTVMDTWQGGRVGDQLLATLGFVVFRCDPRSASGKGACSTWTAYRQLGVQELKDIEAAMVWLKSHSFVDPNRVGMSGTSYGGYMTAYALTHSKHFAAGISGAPVTDWRNYDTIYTERYMNTPQENPEGYARTSVVRAARNLHGKLLILHGLMDDNVHMQNTAQLVNELQRAGKDFELMVYPRARHGGFGRHYQRLQIDFMTRALGVKAPPPSSPQSQSQ